MAAATILAFAHLGLVREILGGMMVSFLPQRNPETLAAGLHRTQRLAQ